MARKTYDHVAIEKNAQEMWASRGIYVADLESEKDPYYLLVEFPYPSGDLHVGHWYAFSVTDIFARFKRMQGFEVLFPFGFDAFGLPAENAAIKRGLDPRKWTYENMEAMTRQVKTMGSSFDWSKSFATCDPEYYRWTQWLFARLYENDLAYRGKALVNWDPVDMTVLANEQVLPDGTAERSGAMVEKKELEQWFMRITNYADRLITDLDELPWREEIKVAQKAWIGKSEGASIPFKLLHNGKSEIVQVFTTRPDTLFGVTYVVLAPELPLVDAYVQNGFLGNVEEVKAYAASTKSKTDRDRMQSKEKTGVLLEGVVAIHPITGQELPVYIADYVLGGYGTGVVMGVPAHDERDFAFATKYQLPITQVIARPFIQTTEPGVFRPNEPTVEKDGIIAIIKHWNEDKYLGVKWKEVAWGTFLTGGVDDGMSPEETVLKEIREETGYLHAEIIAKLAIVDGIFYHVPKKKNQNVHGHVFYVELENDEREELSEEEASKHDLVWLSKEELQAFLTPDTHHYALETFFHGYKPYDGPGSLVNSAQFNGRKSEEVGKDMVAAAGGEMTTSYRLRDWLISRQRYWGCPIPIVYDPEGKAHLMPDEHLPWLLPDDVDFTPGKFASPLMSSVELKERVTRIFGAGWTPEYDTFDTFVDSSWYFLRYLASKDAGQFSDSTIMQKWMPVDRYSGGSEHTTLHLLYARFFNKALFDLGLAPTTEPFIERMNRGLIADAEGKKMSKSKGNVVNPDEPVKEFGADAVRMYLAFIGPYNEPGTYPWKPSGVEAMRRFLDRVYTLREKVSMAGDEPSRDEQKAIAKATERMTIDIERFKLNTAVSALMILMNELETQESVSRKTYTDLLTLLAPFAPHLAEHLFGEMGNSAMKGENAEGIHQKPWLDVDQGFLKTETVTIGVQIAGKRRGEITISATATEEEALHEARQVPTLATLIGEGNPSRIIYIPGKIFNIIP